MQLYQTFYSRFKAMYYASITVGIIASSCIGAVAAMLILMNGYGPWQMFQLFLIVAVAMTFNATVLAQLKPKFIFNSLIVSLLTSLVVIIAYTLF